METPLNSSSNIRSLTLAGVPVAHLAVWAALFACAALIGSVIRDRPVLGILLSVALILMTTLLTVRFRDLLTLLGLGLMLGLGLRGRLFAQIAIVAEPVQLYPVDAALLFLAASFGLEALRRGKVPRIPILTLLLIWFGLGMVALIRGFLLYDDSVLLESRIPTASLEVEILRDSVMVFYAIYTIFFAVAARNERFLRLLLGTSLVLAVISSISTLARRFGLNMEFLPYNTLLYTGIITVIAWTFAGHLRLRWRLLTYAASLILLFDVALSGDVSRALLVGLVGTYFYVSFIAAPRIPLLQIRRLLILASIGLTILLIVVISYLDRPDMLLRTNTADFRLDIWKLTFERALERPIFGWAFGNPMVTATMLRSMGHWAPTNDPHNTLLALFFRLGLVGSLVFAWINVAFFLRCLRAIRLTTSPVMRDALRAISGIQVFTILFGVFNLLLETPHYGFWYWAVLGVGLTLASAELERIDAAHQAVHG